MNENDLYREILLDIGVTALSPSDALWIAVILHTHQITLRPEVELEECQDDDDPGPITMLPMTSSRAAELFASLWPEDDERGQHSFWRFLYLKATPYESLGDIPPALRHLADAARQRIEGHRFVAALTED